jgi:tetratricopeptide (TPR) repeat protein
MPQTGRTAPTDLQAHWAHAILVAGHHAGAETVRLEAEELGLILKLDAEMARRQLRQQFLGRQVELERLKSLEPGEWAWVQGASGMGKTSLLRQLAPQATYLLARQGLPLATLEPLLGAKITEGNTVMLRYLSRLEGLILLDGWEFMDTESQELIANWRALHSPARVVIASNQTLPFALNTTLKLQFLEQTELELVPEVFERTGGVPSLVGAFLRGEPIESILEQRLKTLDENARNLLAGLTLLERPRLPLLARVFNLNAISLDIAKQALVTQGLIDLAGNVRALEAAQHWLEALPQLTAAIVTELAPHLSPLEAFPLYQKIFGIVPKEQLAHYQAAALAWAKESLHRGRPIVALQALEHLPNDPEVALTRARIHEQAGAYKQALETLPAGDTSSIAALRSALLVRLGHPEEARVAAERALEGEPRDRAEGLNTLAHIEMAAGNLEAAKDYFRRSAPLWLMAGEQGRHAYSLNNIAVLLAKVGQPSDAAFEKAIQAAGDHPTLSSSVLLNRGFAFEKVGKFDSALKNYHEAGKIAEEYGIWDTASRAWNNIGVVYHNQGKKNQARTAYHHALELAHSTNEAMMLASILANLSELDNDTKALEESIILLENAGHVELAARFQEELESFKDRSREAEQAL